MMFFEILDPPGPEAYPRAFEFHEPKSSLWLSQFGSELWQLPQKATAAALGSALGLSGEPRDLSPRPGPSTEEPPQSHWLSSLHRAPHHRQDQIFAERTPAPQPGFPAGRPAPHIPWPHLQQSFADVEVDGEQHVQLRGAGRQLLR